MLGEVILRVQLIQNSPVGFRCGGQVANCLAALTKCCVIDVPPSHTQQGTRLKSWTGNSVHLSKPILAVLEPTAGHAVRPLGLHLGRADDEKECLAAGEVIRSLADRTELCRSLDSKLVHDAAAYVASRLASPRQPSGSCIVAASERETLPAPLLSLRPKYRLPGENIAPTRTGQVTLTRGLGHTLTPEFPLRRRFLVGERERTDPCAESVRSGVPGRSRGMR